MKGLMSFFVRTGGSPKQTTPVRHVRPVPLDPVAQAYLKYGPRVARSIARSTRNKAPSSEGSSCPSLMFSGCV